MMRVGERGGKEYARNRRYYVPQCETGSNLADMVSTITKFPTEGAGNGAHPLPKWRSENSLGGLVPADDNAGRLEEWISTTQEANRPHVHSFIRGLRLDQDAVRAALTSSYHNGDTGGVNTKTKLIKRQMYGRAAFHLLRHRILLQ